MKKVIVLLGPPGSGKGTQAGILGEKTGYFIFRTGDLMREEAKKGTELGMKFEEVWARGKGELVQTELVEKFVEQKISEMAIHKGLIIDGYPRSMSQAMHLEKVLGSYGHDYIVIDIESSPKLLIKRMETRKICAKCGKIFFQPEKTGIIACDKCDGQLIQREEDKPGVLTKRIEVYEKETRPVIDYFKKKDRVIKVNGEPDIETVSKDIYEKLNERN